MNVSLSTSPLPLSLKSVKISSCEDLKRDRAERGEAGSGSIGIFLPTAKGLRLEGIWYGRGLRERASPCSQVPGRPAVAASVGDGKGASVQPRPALCSSPHAERVSFHLLSTLPRGGILSKVSAAERSPVVLISKVYTFTEKFIFFSQKDMFVLRWRPGR